MTTSQQVQISRDLSAILEQGADPKVFRQALAGAHCVTAVEVDLLIAQLTEAPRQADPEDIAQERIRQDRQEARDSPWRPAPRPEGPVVALEYLPDGYARVPGALLLESVTGDTIFPGWPGFWAVAEIVEMGAPAQEVARG